MNDAILEVKNFNVSIQQQQILYNISATIPRNKISCIIGQSGAGKSTFLRALVRFLSSTGSLLLHTANGSVDLYSLPTSELRRLITYLPQIPAMFKGTVYDNIRFGLDLWHIDEIDYVSLLSGLDLPEDILYKDAHSLSVGQQQRVALVRLLALSPHVVLLDEPTASLDAMSRELFDLNIKRLVNTTDVSVVLVTHSIEQALKIADYILLFDQGNLIYQGAAADLFKQVSSIHELSEGETLDAFIQYGGISK